MARGIGFADIRLGFDDDPGRGAGRCIVNEDLADERARNI
jgi:hypothetical protein